MPAATKPQDSGYISVRGKDLFITPPCTMGFSDLVNPDEAFGKIEFKVNGHFDADGAERLAALVDAHVIEPLWPKMLEAMEAKGKRGKRPDAQEWVEEQLKDPTERSRIQLPHIQFKNAADYRDKQGQTQRKTMGAWDARGTALDLPQLHLGMGSTIQVISQPMIWMSPLVKQPTIKLGLQGVRVLKLVAFGGGQGGSRVGSLSEADMAALGNDFQPEDLSGFAAPTRGGASSKPGSEFDPAHDPKPAARRRQSQASDFAADLDDEIPF